MVGVGGRSTEATPGSRLWVPQGHPGAPPAKPGPANAQQPRLRPRSPSPLVPLFRADSKLALDLQKLVRAPESKQNPPRTC